jgi:hypothetical protein
MAKVYQWVEKGYGMSVLNKAWLLVGAGFLAGAAGLKLLASKPAKKLYVQGVAAGMRAKEYYEEIVEEAKASMDDIVAEASYLNATKQPEAKTEAAVGVSAGVSAGAGVGAGAGSRVGATTPAPEGEPVKIVTGEARPTAVAPAKPLE